MIKIIQSNAKGKNKKEKEKNRGSERGRGGRGRGRGRGGNRGNSRANNETATQECESRDNDINNQHIANKKIENSLGNEQSNKPKMDESLWKLKSDQLEKISKYLQESHK